ncbi:MAG TPA: AAA family ATPase [bacterium]|jgi:predicted AAA+ superfamily ATPase|nr:AAA family ATPase [bacterium]
MPKYLERPATRAVLLALERWGGQTMQIMSGPRQVGKSTASRQIADKWRGPAHFAVADEALPPGPEWIAQQWESARALKKRGVRPLLVLDEVQKVSRWSEVVKRLWDEEKRSGEPLRVLLLGSSALLVQKGLGESLAGRFLLHRFPHWSFPEMRDAFAYSFEDWLRFGGYPGAAAFHKKPEIWRAYVRDSLLEPILAKDVLQMSAVGKPALLRHLLLAAAALPAHIVTWEKMLGQLQDAGNTTTLAHYAELLEGAYVLSALQPWRGEKISKRGGSPKFIVWNNAIVSAVAASHGGDDSGWRGRLMENAVGGHILNHLPPDWRLFYWREGDAEVDFVLRTPEALWAIEVKSGRRRQSMPGMAAFMGKYPKARPMLIGADGMDMEKFFGSDPVESFSVR